jgi:hypothetical protein
MSELKIDLRGLDLNEEEMQELLSSAHASLLKILENKAHPEINSVVALGPGWIGIEAYANNLPEQSD